MLLRELDFQTSKNDKGFNHGPEHDFVHLQTNSVFAKPFHVARLIFYLINYESLEQESLSQSCHR